MAQKINHRFLHLAVDENQTSGYLRSMAKPTTSLALRYRAHMTAIDSAEQGVDLARSELRDERDDEASERIIFRAEQDLDRATELLEGLRANTPEHPSHC